MHSRYQGWVAGALTLAVVLSLTGSAAAAHVGVASDSGTEQSLGESAAASTTQTAGTIVQTKRYALTPDQPGSVRMTITYELPDQMRSLQTQLVDEGTVTGTDGFERVNETVYEWDESTATPTLTLTYNPNETSSSTGPGSADGKYLFADAGEWALFRQFRVDVGFSYSKKPKPGFERRARTAGPGTIGDRVVYLGEFSTTERTANGQTFRLVVPEAAELNESTAAILSSLASASGSMQVGDRDEEVTAFAAPTNRVSWALRGLNTGDTDFWVRDFERVDKPANVWVHEYIHTRQDFETTAETKWLTEATAQYYAALLTFEQGRIDFEMFQEELARGERQTYDDVMLSWLYTWNSNADYFKGALATGRIDLAIRAATNQSETFEAVFEELNAESESVTQTEFLDIVAATGGDEPRATATETTETKTPLSMWDRRNHSQQFGTLSTQSSYTISTTADGYRVRGPYRNDTISSTPIRLVTGERLTVDTVVSNVGDEASTYNATLTVDDRSVTSVAGKLDANSERTIQLSHTFNQTDEYTLGVGDETVTVVVGPLTDPIVSAVRVESDQEQEGDSAVVTATVRNDAVVPANGTVTFMRDSEPVTRRTVALKPGESRELSVSVKLPASGTARLSAEVTDGGAFTVADPTDGPVGLSGGSGGTVPGISAITAVLVALATLLARRR
jgi:hypothetical protein